MIQPSTLDYALHYASLGMRVLPLHYITNTGRCSCGGDSVNTKCKPGKHPYSRLVPHGVNDASCDTEQVRQWFTNTPYNIGLATGRVSGIFVLDRDDRDGGESSVHKFETEHGELPHTLSQTTGNGVHYVFQMPLELEIKNSAGKLAPGIDIRGNGGYVVAAPSKHLNGKVYTWNSTKLPLREEIAPAPSWLVNLAMSRTRVNNAAKLPVTNIFTAEQFTIPDQIKDGEGREEFILRYSGHLRNKGLDQLTVERTLLDYNQLHISPPLDDEVVLDRSRRYQQVSATPQDEWPDPEDISSSLPDVFKFDERLLPGVFAPWIKDIAERMQCPIEYLAVGALVGAGAVLGNRIGVQPKQHDTGWVEVPNLWGAVVGRPGVMKSPALDQVLYPIRKLEAAAQAAFATTLAKYEIDRMVYEATKKQLEAQIKKGGGVSINQLPVEPQKPEPPRFLLNDATYQKLGQVLSGNPHGVLVFQDELSGLLVRLDEKGQEAARAFYLEAWNGKQGYTFDRVERGTLHIPRLCISLLGGLQPTKLREYLHSAVSGGRGDDGLAQRLQLLVYPDLSKQWSMVDRSVDLAAADAANDVFVRLAGLDPISLGAKQVYTDSIPVLQFTESAQERFNSWWVALEINLRSGTYSPFIESHISKYRKLVPTLALLDHLILGYSGDIGIDSLKRAIAWQKFLLSHAERAYAAVTAGSKDAAKALAKHIRQGDLKDGFTVRNVYRKNWSLLSTVREATEATEVLQDMGWLRAVRDDKVSANDGRPAVRYLINPKVVTGG
jgi:putative DNA primase/helicase